MQIPSLGKVVNFGDIYDARTNEIVTGVNAFKVDLNTVQVITVQNSYSSYKYTFAMRETEKIEAWDIDGELKLKIPCGVLQVSGSAKFLKGNRSTKKFIQCSCILKNLTQKESIQWRTPDGAKLFDFEGIKGTHMVIGIQYGGNGVVTFRYTSDETTNLTDIKGSLKGKLKHIPHCTGETSVSGSNREVEKINDSQIDVSVEADVNFESSDNVTTVDGAKAFIEKLGERFTKYNNGKGVQVAYELISLETVFDYFKKQISESHIFIALSKNIISNIYAQLIELEKVQEELADTFDELEENKEYYLKCEQEKWRDDKLKTESAITNVYDQINKTLEISHERDTSSEMKKITVKITELKSDVSKFSLDYEKLICKSDFIKMAKKNKIIYLSKEKQLIQLKLQQKKLSICFLPVGNYRKHLNLITEFILESNMNVSDAIYILIDGDFLSEVIKQEMSIEQMPENVFYVYENGTYKTNSSEDKEENTRRLTARVNDLLEIAKNPKYSQFYEQNQCSIVDFINNTIYDPSDHHLIKDTSMIILYIDRAYVALNAIDLYLKWESTPMLDKLTLLKDEILKLCSKDISIQQWIIQKYGGYLIHCGSYSVCGQWMFNTHLDMYDYWLRSSYALAKILKENPNKEIEPEFSFELDRLENRLKTFFDYTTNPGFNAISLRGMISKHSLSTIYPYKLTPL